MIIPKTDVILTYWIKSQLDYASVKDSIITKLLNVNLINRRYFKMKLVLDIGNTLAKAGIFENVKLLGAHTFRNMNQLQQWVWSASYESILVSSVAEEPAWLKELKERHPHCILLNADTPLPFHNLYETPRTLGTDRIASVAGAMALFPGRAALAIDAGSCITYDFIDSRKQYHGGSISPGIQMRCKAMHTFTARLPLVQIKSDEADEIQVPGKTTTTALQSGAFHGTLAEITQMIRMYEDKFGDLQVVICGGDAPQLSKVLPVKHQLVPELILIGLNAILDHNVA